MSLPPIITCASCFRAEDVTAETDYLTQEWVYTCNGNDHGGQTFVWRKPVPITTNAKVQRDGYFADLGVHETLMTLIHEDDPWLEYGVVEDRFRRKDPALYAKLVHEFSHSARNAIRGGPDENPARTHTVSMRLAQALSALAEEGLIASRIGPATGYWGSYLSKVSHWAPRPAPSAEKVLTWSNYATAAGLDPDTWILP
jgi:hypothetical protein